MRIAIASGKGGTGKTTVAAALAVGLAHSCKLRYIDCDVEEPNGHLFLKPDLTVKADAAIQIPKIQTEKCTACGKCVEVCQYHALAKIGEQILVFPQLCHGCGSCTWNCPEGAILEVPNNIGILEQGFAPEGIQFFRGMLTVSEPMPTPLIRQLKKWLPRSADSIDLFDSPPGASCSVVETLRGADFVILVTEPTPFGLHDLRQIVSILREMKIPAGVIINRVGKEGSTLIEKYCEEEGLKILYRIPFERKIAEGIARGQHLLQIHPEFLDDLETMMDHIKKECD